MFKLMYMIIAHLLYENYNFLKIGFIINILLIWNDLKLYFKYKLQRISLKIIEKFFLKLIKQVLKIYSFLFFFMSKY